MPAVDGSARMAPCGGAVFPDAGLVERDADPFLLAPGDAARSFQLFRSHRKREALRDEQRRHDFERGSGLGDVSNGAVDSSAAELDGSGLQSAAPRDDSGLFQDVVIGDSRPDASRPLLIVTTASSHRPEWARRWMRDYTRKEKVKITAGAVTAVVVLGWLAVFAFALLSTP